MTFGEHGSLPLFTFSQLVAVHGVTVFHLTRLGSFAFRELTGDVAGAVTELRFGSCSGLSSDMF